MVPTFLTTELITVFLRKTLDTQNCCCYKVLTILEACALTGYLILATPQKTVPLTTDVHLKMIQSLKILILSQSLQWKRKYLNEDHVI